MLGSTGSIGRSTLAVLRRHPDQFRLVALTARRDRDGLAAQVAEWRPPMPGWPMATPGDGCCRRFCSRRRPTPTSDIVVNAVVGAAGLDATLAALRAGQAGGARQQGNAGDGW